MDASAKAARRLLRIEQVLTKVPFSRPALYRAIKAGKFPQPCKVLGARGSAWDEREVDLFIEQRLAARGRVEKAK